MNPSHEIISLNTSQPMRIIVGDDELGTPAHWHQELEIVHVLDGELEIVIEGRLHALRKGDILLISTCAIHKFHPNPLGCRKIILQLGKSAFDGYADAVFGRKFATPHLTGGELHARLRADIFGILREWETRRPGHELVWKARMNDLCASILRCVPMEPYSAQERTRQLERIERLNAVLAYIETGCGAEITLQRAAEVAGFSVTYFSRFFKEATGSGFVDYVNAYRIGVATTLLQGAAGESVTDIAFRSGFNSIETFNRAFKKINGCTPSQYRSKK